LEAGDWVTNDPGNSAIPIGALLPNSPSVGIRSPADGLQPLEEAAARRRRRGGKEGCGGDKTRAGDETARARSNGLHFSIFSFTLRLEHESCINLSLS
jgi:hypothetical protein